MSTSICPKCGLTQSSLTGFCKACGTRLKADGPASMTNKPGLLGLGGLVSRRGLLIATGVAVAVLLLIWLFVGKGDGDQASAGLSPTNVPSSPAASPSGQLVGAAITNSTVPTTLPSTAVPAPTVVPTTINALSTPTPPTVPPTAIVAVPVANEIAPSNINVNVLPMILTVKGSNLDLVQDVALVHVPDPAIHVAFKAVATDQITMSLDPLQPSSEQVLTFTLQLNGQTQDGIPVVIQFYLENKAVQGVKAEYAYTDRINPNGLYTRMRTDSRVDSKPIGMIYNGDTVAILRADQDKWYKVRVLSSRGATQQDVTGWIERWIVDDTDVPPPPPPPPSPAPDPIVRFGVRIDVNYEGSGNSGQFTSCVAGRVRDANGKPYVGAQLNVNNGSKNSFPAKTNRNGIYRVCGLGPSHWDVVLLGVPGVKLAQQFRGVVYLNGGSQEAIVHFTQR